MLAGDLDADEKARLGARLARQKRERDTRVAVEANTNRLIRAAELEAGVNAGAIDEDAIERALIAGDITPAVRDRLKDKREANQAVLERRAETVAHITSVVTGAADATTTLDPTDPGDREAADVAFTEIAARIGEQSQKDQAAQLAIFTERTGIAPDAAADAIRLVLNTGNITGTIDFYGITNS